MTHQQELVAYVAQYRRGGEEAARAWLDTHCPEWQSSKLIEGRLIEPPVAEACDE